MSFSKYTSFFPLTIYSLSLLPNNQKIISLSTHFHSFNILSSYFLSFYLLFSDSTCVPLRRECYMTLVNPAVTHKPIRLLSLFHIFLCLKKLANVTQVCDTYCHVSHFNWPMSRDIMSHK